MLRVKRRLCLRGNMTQTSFLAKALAEARPLSVMVQWFATPV